MRITRRHITLVHHADHSGLTTFRCDITPAHLPYRFQVYARGERAWRAATKFFNSIMRKTPCSPRIA